MKRVTLSLIAVVFITSASFSQKLHLGVKAGANLGKVDGQSFNDGFNLSYQAGGFAEIDFGKLGIQPEVLFSQTTTKYTQHTGDILNLNNGQNVNLNYLSIPVLLRINSGKLLTLHLGPQFSVLINPHETTLQNGKDAFKGGDLGMIGGVQLNFGMLRAYGRYNIGLNNINDFGNSDKWKNQQLQLGVGLKLL